MTQRLKDKVAVITGAASGIGRASVLRFLNEGARVVASDINEDALQVLDQEVGDDAAKMTLKSGSVSQRSDVESIIDYAVVQFGRIDILVNSAGITPRTVRPEADFEERWEAVIPAELTKISMRPNWTTA
jgi:3-oxoacyl-[acyl-carrier protein] reductase